MVDETKPVHPVASRTRWPFTRRQIVGQVIVAAVILASGIGIGVGGTILSLKDRIMRVPIGDPPRPPGPPEWLIDRWRADLSLTDEQVQQIKDVFTQRMTAARDQWKKMMELQQQEQDQFAASMKSILTPEQFTKWKEEFDRAVDHWRPRGPGGPGGPGGFDRKRKLDHFGGPGRSGGPDGYRDHRARDMKEPNSQSDGPLSHNGPAPDSPRPEGPPPESPPPQ